MGAGRASELTVAGSPGRPVRVARRGRRWPAVALVIAFAVAKADGIAQLAHHRDTLIALVAAALVARVVLFKPVVVAQLAAVLVALAVAPHPLIAGVALAVGALIAILTLMVAVGTLLRARDRRR